MEQVEQDKSKKKSHVKKTLLIILCVFLAVVLIILAVATIYIESKYNKINKADDSTLNSGLDATQIQDPTDTVPDDFTGEVISDQDAVSTEPVEMIESGEDVINILLIGQDARPGQGIQRSDAMLLCTINTNVNKITISSFMRDCYVQIPGYYSDKLAHSYAYGGIDGGKAGAMQLLDDTIAHNFGVQIDGNLEVDFSRFIEVIDLIGGIDMEISDDEAYYVSEYSHIPTSGGLIHMNGAQALGYARIRVLDTDFGRTNRQRKVISALLEKAKTLSITELDSLLDSVLPLLTTDMSMKQITHYAMALFPMLSDFTVETVQIPADGTWYNAVIEDTGSMVLKVDFDANREILKSIMEEK